MKKMHLKQKKQFKVFYSYCSFMVIFCFLRYLINIFINSYYLIIRLFCSILSFYQYEDGLITPGSNNEKTFLFFLFCFISQHISGFKFSFKIPSKYPFTVLIVSSLLLNLLPPKQVLRLGNTA